MPYADPEKKKQKDKEYREANREYYRKKALEHYEKNKAEKLEYGKEYYEKNKEARLEYAKKRNEFKKKKVKEYNYKESEARKKESMKNFPRNAESIRFKDHLDYSYSQELCRKEYEKIGRTSGTYHTKDMTMNKIILTYQPHFYKVEKERWLNDVDGIRDFLLKNRLKYIYKDEYQINDKEVLRGFKISGKYIGFTHFNPLWIKGFIEKHGINSLYDPCAGWGHRLLGACSTGIDYICNDFDEETTQGLLDIIEDFNIDNATVYNEDCKSFIPEEDYEAVFTCPPYYNVERYNGKTFKDIEDFDNFLYLMVKNSLKPSVKIVGIVMNVTYMDNVEKACKDNGLTLEYMVEFGSKKNHFQRDERNIVKNEILMVFKR